MWPRHTNNHDVNPYTNLQYFTLVQNNPFPNKPCCLSVCSTNLLKKLWEKEKLLVTSNFSLSHIVLQSFGEIFGIFIKFEIVVFEVLWENENMLDTSILSFSHNFFQRLFPQGHQNLRLSGTELSIVFALRGVKMKIHLPVFVI